MKVILLETVVNLGELGDVVEVANGYARNFLIPNGKAVRANEQNIREFEAKRASYEQKQAEILANAKARSLQLEGKVFALQAKAGVDGKLFGSINIFDIVEAVTNSGIELKKSEVNLSHGALKTVGEFDVNITLHHDVKTAIKVNITSEA
jgi:large subunit ribosomal protein L9